LTVNKVLHILCDPKILAVFTRANHI